MNGYIALIRYPVDSVEWLASFPDLPDCRASGRSLDEAVENARSALSTHLADIVASGRALPVARAPGEMLLSANEDHDLANQMIGAVLKFVSPAQGETLRLTAAGARPRGFYGELRRSA